jgi:hypothetical protein
VPKTDQLVHLLCEVPVEPFYVGESEVSVGEVGCSGMALCWVSTSRLA